MTTAIARATTATAHRRSEKRKGKPVPRTAALSANFSAYEGRPLVYPPQDLFADAAEVAQTLGVTPLLATQIILSEWGTRVQANERQRMVAEDVGDLPITQLGEALGVGIPVPMCVRAGKRLLMSRAALEAIAKLPMVDQPGETYLNIRLSPGTSDVSGSRRRVRGVHANFTDSEIEASATTSISVSDPAMWIGKPLVASVAGLVVFAGRILGYDRHGRRTNFRVDTEDSSVRGTFANARIPVLGGGTVVAVTAD